VGPSDIEGVKKRIMVAIRVNRKISREHFVPDPERHRGHKIMPHGAIPEK
jgi:hypothetical protein